MKFEYKLDEQDLKDYYKFVINHDPQNSKYRWKIRALGYVPLLIGFACVTVSNLSKTTILIGIGLLLLWFIITEVIIFPYSTKKLLKAYIDPIKNNMEEMIVDIDEKSTKLNNKKVNVNTFATLPKVFVIIDKNGGSIIIPYRALDNSKENLDKLIEIMTKQLYGKEEK